MEKKCRVCEKVKNVKYFYTVKNNKDGFDTKCRMCKIDYAKNYKKNNPSKPPKNKNIVGSFDYKLSPLKKEDFYSMYKLLEKLGYDIKGDIHQQFIDRHNIPTYKKRNNNSRNKWDYDELF
jgi:hypothetical protein